MKKFLDDAFCEYVLENKLADENSISKIHSRKDIITIRESLLLEGYLSFKTYCLFISDFQTDKNLLDSIKSKEWDQNFLETSGKKGYTGQKDIEWAKKQAESSPLSAREFLLINQIISYQNYRNVMFELANPSYANAEDTLVDGSIKIMQDESAETIIDCAPLQEKVVDLTEEDGSAETVVDQKLDISEKTVSDSSERTLVADELEISGSIEKNSELTWELSYQAALADEISHSASLSSSQKLPSKAELEKTIDSDWEESVQKVPTPRFREDEISPVLVNTIAKKISEEVSLKTQELKRQVDMEKPPSPKIFVATLLFFCIFLAVFTGWIEFQRLIELQNLRKSEKEAIQALTEKEREFLKENNQNLFKIALLAREKQDTKKSEDLLRLTIKEKDALQLRLQSVLKEKEQLKKDSSSILAFMEKILKITKRREKTKSLKLAKTSYYLMRILFIKTKKYRAYKRAIIEELEDYPAISSEEKDRIKRIILEIKKVKQRKKNIKK